MHQTQRVGAGALCLSEPESPRTGLVKATRVRHLSKNRAGEETDGYCAAPACGGAHTTEGGR